ncbi:MAG TPA: hypothetical protein VKQ11_14665 [Candidatus Sulfotelmatobacter sp.]|nr:hypothetical protein [Candidatus Sulfotelmatobacter sp.]
MARVHLKFTALAILVIGGMWAAHHHWIHVRSFAWHILHGQALQIGEYVFPVPWNWYPQEAGNGERVLARLDTDDRTPRRRMKAHASIVLLPKQNNPDVNLQLSKRLDLLKKGGVDTVLQQNVNVNGDVMSCIGGHKFDSYGLYDSDPVTWYCKSFGGLDMVLTATEVDLKEAWDLVARIEKKR